MKQNIYNAKLHNAELNNAKLNKQIFDLSDDTNNIVPDENEALYWLTYEDGKLISNYKVGEEEITQPVEDELTSEQKAILNKIGQNNGDFTYNGKIIKGEVKVSEEANNILVQKDDGLFVDGSQFGSQVEISENSDNILTKDGTGALYVPAPENKAALDKINQNSDGDFTYDGKIIKGEAKVSALANNILVQKDDGLFVDGSSKINKLLFRIPVIQNVQEIYHLKVQFSTTGDFKDIETIDTINNYLLFKIFDGTLKQFPIDENENNEIISVGITSVYSDEQIQLDISSINEEYKYFRFQWSNDGGDSYGRYGYGNTQALQSIFDITSVETNVINSNKQIFFTHQDSEFVTWNDNVATFTHNMNCIPITTIYDDSLEQVLYGIKIIDGNSFLIDFKEYVEITNPWRIIINYGVKFNIQ